MDRIYFTEEQINELSKNSYVEKVTNKTITFTKEFKEHLKENYQTNIDTMFKTNANIGYDIFSAFLKNSVDKQAYVFINTVCFIRITNDFIMF